MKTKSVIDAARADRSNRQALNPLAGLTPEALMSYLDRFRRGYLGQAATAWELMEHRDDVISVVAPKRKKGVAHHGWEIVLTEETPAAVKQKTVLEDFYNNLTTTSALDPNEEGGIGTLFRQMMDAVGKRYAVHEIIWSRTATGGLSANFRFCPLWWFEATTGPLRFLVRDTDPVGVPLEPGGWLITTGEGIMEPASLAWLVKHWTLKDWSLYSARHGMPWIKGVSDSQHHSPAWEAMQEAVKVFAESMATVVAAGGTIEAINTTGTGTPPYEALVDRMDRALARIWLGSDLSTMSRASAVGASLQGEASETLAAEDCIALGETLAKYVSKYVLEDSFGEGFKRLAYLKLRSDPKTDVEMDLRIDTFLSNIGAPLGVRALLERYGRPLPGSAEAVINPQVPGNARVPSAGSGVSPESTPRILPAP